MIGKLDLALDGQQQIPATNNVSGENSREELVLQLKQEIALLNAEAERNTEQVSDYIIV